NARLKPVTMMMTTAITLATGPSIDSRIRCSGASHGMPEPAAIAGVAIIMKAIANSRCANGLPPVPARGDPEPPSFCDLQRAGGLAGVPPGGLQGGSPVA